MLGNPPGHVRATSGMTTRCVLVRISPFPSIQTNILCVQLRYRYRLYPSPGQQQALARAFGCARVVFNDALAARQDAHQAGLPCPADAELSARLAASKATPERAWLGEVSAMMLQQALADLRSPAGRPAPSASGRRPTPASSEGGGARG